MQLSTIRRLRAHVFGAQSAPMAAKPDNDRLLIMWLQAISDMIEKYLDRDLQNQAYTELFPVKRTQTKFPLRAFPVTGINSILFDPFGKFEEVYDDDGNLSGDLSEYSMLDERGSSVILNAALNYDGPRALKVSYVGGLTETVATSKISLGKELVSPPLNSWKAGDWAKADNGAVGIVTDVSLDESGNGGWLPTLTVEDYYGTWEKGSNVQRWTSETEYNSDHVESGVIFGVPQQSLIQLAPAIVMAAETQIRYMWKHTTDFENIGSNKDGGSSRRTTSPLTRPWSLLPEVEMLLQPYVRSWVL
jgi:hypothetical protein